VVTAEQMLVLQSAIREVSWQPEVERYLLGIVRATRSHPAVQLGVSPRGTLALYRACQAFAALQGRDYVQPDDVKHLAASVLAHRLLTTSRSRMRGQQSLEIMSTIVEKTPVPVEKIAPPQSSR
jgi:MoxR-like ATPase